MPSFQGDLNIPSPIRVDSPKTSLMNVHPVIPFLPPPPFMSGPNFMPPPPLGHNDLSRPLGRFVTSPTALNRGYSPAHNDHSRGRYSPDSRYRDDYSVMDDYTETDFSPPLSPVRRNKSYRRDGGLS